jgi:tripartite-type tricarboxylate transporter receptor subunit TctC
MPADRSWIGRQGEPVIVDVERGRIREVAPASTDGDSPGPDGPRAARGGWHQAVGDVPGDGAALAALTRRTGRRRFASPTERRRFASLTGRRRFALPGGRRRSRSYHRSDRLTHTTWWSRAAIRDAVGQIVSGRVSMAAALAAIAIVATPGPVRAQAFPSKPITMIVPFAPGGSTDISTRRLAEAMSPLLGQSVIVENKAGAAGGIGINAVAKAKPDGYTLGISGVGPTILLNLSGQFTQYVALRDLAFIAHMNDVELVLVGRKDSPVNNLQDLIAAARANPEKVSIGNSGLWGPVHLAAELLAQQAKVKLNHVPYKGDLPTLQDIIGGHVDAGITSAPGASSHIKSGAVKALATLGSARSASLPDIATAAEQGLAGYEASVFQIIVAPIKTPAPVIARLNEAINKALASETIKSEYAKLGMVPVGGSPADASALVKRETEKWTKVIERIQATTK